MSSGKSRPNVLWIMCDQLHADCLSAAGHPDVKTPNIDRIADRGVRYTRAYANNPICSPSRICFNTGMYAHTHGVFGNYNAERPIPNPGTIAAQFRRYGYQTALTGKSHMVRRWDQDGFELIRYSDLCDATHDDPRTCHYFAHLDDLGLADLYEEGAPKPGHENSLDGSRPALLPYEHSIERYTGDTTLQFLKGRDSQRPFFLEMSFQRPHSPITPAPEHFDRYDPASLTIPDSAVDFFENSFSGKPAFMQEYIERGGSYPLAKTDPDVLRQCLASYYALISAIDDEIGRVLDYLEETSELDNTVLLFHADHGDFAGDHGLFHKNFGIYESIHRIPWIMSWPGGPQGIVSDHIIESVDWFPTCAALCDVPVLDHCEGVNVTAPGFTGKDQAWAEWHWMKGAPGKCSAIRTKEYRLVFYNREVGGELYDHRVDPGELHNLWSDPEYASIQRELMERLFEFTLCYKPQNDMEDDIREIGRERYSPTVLLQKEQRFWTELREVYEKETRWPVSNWREILEKQGGENPS